MALKADPDSDKRPSLRKWLRGLRWSILPGHAWVGTAWIGPAGAVRARLGGDRMDRAGRWRCCGGGR